MELTGEEELVEHLVEFYDRVAPEYESWAGGLHGKVAAKLVEVASPSRGKAVLDVGCGTGLVTHLVAASVGARGSVVGIDLSARMLNLARRRSRKNTTFMAMAAERMVFREGSFDLITYGQSLPYLMDPFASLGEAARLLRPGGRVALSLHRRSLQTEAQDLFYRVLGDLAARHHLRVPEHSPERSAYGERENLPRLLDELGFGDVRMTEMVTGGRVRTPREWTDLMGGSGPLPNTLIRVLGPRLRAEFEAELADRMKELGEDAFRYHFAFIFAVAVLGP
ncbi:MAG TPA: methyltransferase domain-containing protein [Candidatus Dormibacteraeota bacterium]|nr:methyltransferase domain-containing protein [Candidatus Dormibacteraeota bacterium]